MKTRMYFHLNDKSQTQILSINDNVHPFYFKGDIFWYDMSDIYPKTINHLRETYKESFVNDFCKSYSEEQKKFNHRSFKIVKVFNSLQYDINNEENTLVVEYTCREVKNIYWKFWKTYKFKQFIKKYFHKSK